MNTKLRIQTFFVHYYLYLSPSLIYIHPRRRHFFCVSAKNKNVRTIWSTIKMSIQFSDLSWWGCSRPNLPKIEKQLSSDRYALAKWWLLFEAPWWWRNCPFGRRQISNLEYFACILIRSRCEISFTTYNIFYQNDKNCFVILHNVIRLFFAHIMV